MDYTLLTDPRRPCYSLFYSLFFFLFLSLSFSFIFIPSIPRYTCHRPHTLHPAFSPAQNVAAVLRKGIRSCL